jgi:hypothetical protein
MDGAPVQLHQGPGGTPPSGPCIGPLHGVCQAEGDSPGGDSRGKADDSSQVVDLGILLQDGDVLHRLGGLASNLATPGSSSMSVLQKLSSLRSPLMNMECKMVDPGVTMNTFLPTVVVSPSSTASSETSSIYTSYCLALC